MSLYSQIRNDTLEKAVVFLKQYSEYLGTTEYPPHEYRKAVVDDVVQTLESRLKEK